MQIFGWREIEGHRLRDPVQCASVALLLPQPDRGIENFLRNVQLARPREPRSCRVAVTIVTSLRSELKPMSARETSFSTIASTRFFVSLARAFSSRFSVSAAKPISSGVLLPWRDAGCPDRRGCRDWVRVAARSARCA